MPHLTLGTGGASVVVVCLHSCNDVGPTRVRNRAYISQANALL